MVSGRFNRNGKWSCQEGYVINASGPALESLTKITILVSGWFNPNGDSGVWRV